MLEQGIQLCKLTYLSGEEFRFLRRRRKFLAESQGQLVKVRRPLRSARSADCTEKKRKKPIGYEPANIGLMQDSLLWRWRRVREYYAVLSWEEKYVSLIK